MANYSVKWEIDVEAESDEEAVQIAIEIMLDPYSEATFFTMKKSDSNEVTEVDYSEIRFPGFSK